MAQATPRKRSRRQRGNREGSGERLGTPDLAGVDFFRRASGQQVAKRVCKLVVHARHALQIQVCGSLQGGGKRGEGVNEDIKKELGKEYELRKWTFFALFDDIFELRDRELAG